MTRTNINKLVYPVPALIAMDGNGNNCGSNFRPMDEVEYVNDKGGYVDQITTDFISWIRLSFYDELSNVYNPKNAYYSKSRNDGLTSGDFDFGKYGANQVADNTASPVGGYYSPVPYVGINAQNSILYTTVNSSGPAKAVYGFPASFYKSVVGFINGIQFDGTNDPQFVSSTGLYAVSQGGLVLLNDYTPGDSVLYVLGSTYYFDTSWDTSPSIDTTFKKITIAATSNGTTVTLGWISASVIDPKRNIFQLSGLIFSTGASTSIKAGSILTVSTAVVGIAISTATCQLSCNFDFSTLQDTTKTFITSAGHAALNTADGGVYTPVSITDANAFNTSSYDADPNIGVVTASDKRVLSLKSITQILLDKYSNLLTTPPSSPTEYGVTSFTQDKFNGVDFSRDVLSQKTLDIDAVAMISLVRGYSDTNALYYLKSTSQLPGRLQSFIFGSAPVGGTNNVVVLGDKSTGRLFWFSASLICQGDLNKDKLILSWIPRDKDGNRVLVTSASASTIWSGVSNYTQSKGMAAGTLKTPSFSGSIVGYYNGTAYVLVDSHNIQICTGGTTITTGGRGGTATQAQAVSMYNGYYGQGWFATETPGLYVGSNSATLTRFPLYDNAFDFAYKAIFLPFMRGWQGSLGTLSQTQTTSVSIGYSYQKFSLPANTIPVSSAGKIAYVSQGKTGGNDTSQFTLGGSPNVFNPAIVYYIEVKWSAFSSLITSSTSKASSIPLAVSGTISIDGKSHTVGSSGAGISTATGSVSGGNATGVYGFFITVTSPSRTINVSITTRDPGDVADPPVDAIARTDINLSTAVSCSIFVSTVGFASNQTPIPPEVSYTDNGSSYSDGSNVEQAKTNAASQISSIVPVFSYQNNPLQALKSNFMSIDNYYSVPYSSGLPQNLLLPKKYDSLLFWFGPNVGGNESIFGGDFSVAEVMDRGGYTLQNKGGSIAGTVLPYPYFYPIAKNSSASFYHIGGNISSFRNINEDMGITISVNDDLTYSSSDIIGYDHIVAYDDYNESAGVIPVMVTTFVTSAFPPLWPSIPNISDALFFKGLTRDSILDKTGMKPLVLSSTFAFASYNPDTLTAKITLPSGTTQTVTVDNLAAVKQSTNDGKFKVTLPGVHTVDADNSNLGRNVYNITAVQLLISGSIIDTINGSVITITNNQGIKWVPTLCERLSDDPTAATAFPFPQSATTLHYVPVFVEVDGGDAMFTSSDKITWTLTVPKGYDAKPRAGRTFPFVIVGQLDGSFVFAFTDPITLF